MNFVTIILVGDVGLTLCIFQQLEICAETANFENILMLNVGFMMRRSVSHLCISGNA
jgi:hypothetical protein